MNATSMSAPPRSVRLRKGADSPILAWAIFLGSLLVSMLTAIYVAHQFLVLFSGDQAQGVVTETRVEMVPDWSDRSETETHYLVSYSFRIDDQPHTGEASVGRFTYRSIKAGDPLTVRYWRPTDGLGSLPKFAKRFDLSSLPSLQSLLLLVVALVFTGGAFSQAWITPHRERRLVSQGIAAAATITQRSKSDDKRPSHRLHFRYTVSAQQRPDGGLEETFEGSQEVSAEFFDRCEEGSSVTVLFLPVSPGRATIYETTRYEIGDSFASPRHEAT